MIFQKLRSTSSSLEKLAILKTATHVDKHIFKRAYDQGVTYGLNYSYISYSTVVSPRTSDEKAELLLLLDSLQTRRLSGNAAREAVEKHAAKYGDLIKLICNKDLDCGVSVGLLDKAFGRGFIEKFKVQLAEEVPLSNVKFPILGEIKYNGVRLIGLKYADGSVELKTRNGNVVPFPALQELIKEYMPLNTMIDGELTVGTSRHENHTSVSGLVTSAMRGTPITRSGLVFNVFDCMPLGDFMQQCHEISYSERRAALNLLFEGYKELQYNQAVMRQGECISLHNEEQANSVFENVVAQGFEGLILKHADHKYKFKRTTDWIKMKAWNDCDLLCIGTTEGEGKYTSMIGGLVCTGSVGSLADGKLVTVVVSSGLTDAMRAADPSEYIGHTIEVLYNDVIYDNAKGTWSLFLPKLVQVRRDK